MSVLVDVAATCPTCTPYDYACILQACQCQTNFGSQCDITEPTWTYCGPASQNCAAFSVDPRAINVDPRAMLDKATNILAPTNWNGDGTQTGQPPIWYTNSVGPGTATQCNQLSLVQTNFPQVSWSRGGPYDSSTTLAYWTNYGRAFSVAESYCPYATDWRLYATTDFIQETGECLTSTWCFASAKTAWVAPCAFAGNPNVWRCDLQLCLRNSFVSGDSSTSSCRSWATNLPFQTGIDCTGAAYSDCQLNDGCVYNDLGSCQTDCTNCQASATSTPPSIPTGGIDSNYRGYAVGTMYRNFENYQCAPGYVKEQVVSPPVMNIPTNIVTTLNCWDDHYAQCQQTTTSIASGQTLGSGPMTSTACGGHGTCVVDWRYNQIVNNASSSNDLRMICACDAGWFPTAPTVGVPYCSQTCKDYQNNIQATCRTHGTCQASSDGASCSCTQSWFGGACEFPLSDVDPNQAFLFNVTSRGSPPTDGTALYSIFFYNAATPSIGSTVRLVTEPVTGVQMTQTIIGGSAIAIYQGGYISTGTKLNFASNLYSAVDPYLSPCILPFFRHPTTKLCVAPQNLPAPITVYSIVYENAPTIACLQLPSDSPSIPITLVRPEDSFGYYCWTAAAFASTAPTLTVTGAGSLVLSCAFRRASGFIVVLASSAQLAWPQIFTAMSDYGCL